MSIQITVSMGHLPGWLSYRKSHPHYSPPTPTMLYRNPHHKKENKIKPGHTEINYLVYESHLNQDSPYLARYDTDSFRISKDTLCTDNLSGNEDHFKDLQLYKGKNVTGISGGFRNCKRRHLCLQHPAG